ncbi:MAG TPA: acyl-CoA dehydrogenase family protein [Pseudolabrys sp.]|jgi:alkylation response protein AidB-like acyl-CoA dehydrogenase
MDPTLSADERALQARAREFSQTVVRPRAAAIDRDEQYPFDIVEALGKAGFLGMTMPKALGGQDRSFLDAVLVIEEMAKSCTVTARIVVETNMGAISTVMAYGSEAQKQVFRRARLFARAAPGAHGARRAHVHNRRRHRAGVAHAGRFEDAGLEAAADARRLRPSAHAA